MTPDEQPRAVSIGKVPQLDDSVLIFLGPSVCVVVDVNGRAIDIITNRRHLDGKEEQEPGTG